MIIEEYERMENFRQDTMKIEERNMSKINAIKQK